MKSIQTPSNQKSLTQATPPEALMAMPAQDFSKRPDVTFGFPSLKTFIARLITFGGALAMTVYATHQMVLIVSQSQVTVLQWVMVALFTLTFIWIALAACGALAGFIFTGRSSIKPTALRKNKTALVMPVYNEDPSQTCAALLSMGLALAQKGVGTHFDIFIISDTTDPDTWVKETAAVNQLKQQLSGHMNVWYRRRFDNSAKKAGNVHEFVSRWGARYEYMLVLDADSLLSADTLISLMNEMDFDPKSGILQTLPCLYRGDTLFARLQQFAGTIYGPIVAQGVTAWQGNDGNYWGHNAIIRVEAFAAAAGLPTIGGIKPFKGDILSHDFVEAALIRRAGWSVKMLPKLKGSWEESPPSLADVAIRDRRWAQGNIQHLAVLPAKGLRWPNRFHMLSGVMGYVASPLWFALVLVGIAMAIQTHFVNIDYFSDEFSLFPTWPVFDSQRMVHLFIGTMLILLVPKFLGLIRSFFSKARRKSLGIVRMTLGALVEILFSVLYAPIFMLIHCKHVFDIFRGRDSGWSAQQRQFKGVPWAQLFKQHIWHTLIGLCLTLVLWYYSPQLLIWLSPTLIGLLLAIPLSGLSGSKGLAKALRYLGLLNIEEEVIEPAIMTARDTFERQLSQDIDKVTIHSLVLNNADAHRHFSMVQGPAKDKRGHPNIHRLSTLCKIEDADSVEEALGWLNKHEKMILLNEPSVFEAIKSLSA
ncbi:MAG: membrane glycosyltransferase [Alphaproteobacteria bacterium]|jgi:membrane glycosyltransferase